MIIAIISIFILTLIVWLINKKLSMKICPVCAGVLLTWLWMLLGMSYGFLSVEKYQIIIAILMGGSVVGITNKLEEKYKIFKLKIRGEDGGKIEKIKDQMEDCC